MTKEQLRIELERQAQRYQDIYGGEVTTYAAKTEPERKPWRKKATLQDRVFQEELQKMEKEKARQEADAQRGQGRQLSIRPEPRAGHR